MLQPRPSHHVRPGFTLVELLVVLLVVAILAAMVTVGVQSVLAKQGSRSDEARLQMLQSMLERTSATGQAGQGLASKPSIPEAALGTTSVKKSSKKTWDGQGSLTTILMGFSADDATPEPDNIVSRTQQVVQRILSVPENRAAIEEREDFLITRFSFGVRSSRNDARDPDEDGDGAGDNSGLMAAADDLAAQPPKNDQSISRGLQLPFFQDSKGNVILFVSEGGVRLHKRNNRDDLAFKDWEWWRAAHAGDDPILVAKNGGPFWMSAGPDGNFATADDNVYSVPVVGYDPDDSDGDGNPYSQ